MVSDDRRSARSHALMIDEDLIKNDEPNCTHLIPNGKKFVCSATIFKF